MMMTKKHFEAIARALKSEHTAYGFNSPEEAEAVKITLRHLAWNLSAEFECTNPRFDRVRFVRACGFEVD